MFGFNFGVKKVIGVDIGTSSLKVVELELKDGKTHLSNYAWMPIPIAYIEKSNSEEGMADFSQFISKYLEKTLKKANIKKTDAFISIPSLGGLIILIDFPSMPPEDMEQAIRFEAHKYIPTSLDEVTISWEIVGEMSAPSTPSGEKGETLEPEKNSGEKVQVLLVAASKAKVLSYEKMIKDAGLNVRGVEIESISLVDSLVGNDNGNFIIVDIGRRMCNIIYVERGTIKINRNIDAGGEDITNSIAKGLGVAREKAESLKLSGRNFFEEAVSLHFSTLDMIVGEIKRVVDTIPRSQTGQTIDALILSGGSANFSGLKDVFQEKLKIKTIIGNPFSRLSFDKSLEPHLGKIRGSFAVCVGLALKGIENMRTK